MSQYIFDNAGQPTGQRFSGLEALFDSWTRQHLAARGIQPDWNCLEVGGGSGSIAAWIAGQLGPSGQLLVTDIDPRFLETVAELRRPNIEIRRHDIGADPLPEQTFDLIHERLVLIHVPGRDEALRTMVAALKPGGWLVVEDFASGLHDRSFPSEHSYDPELVGLVQKMFGSMYQRMAARSSDPTLGRSLYQRLHKLGLCEVGSEGYLSIWQGGSAGSRVDRANFEQLRDEFVGAGLVTNQEVDRVLEMFDDPAFAFSTPIMMTAWGQRPADA